MFICHAVNAWANFDKIWYTDKSRIVIPKCSLIRRKTLVKPQVTAVQIKLSFQEEDKFVYPNTLTLSALRMAQVAIERKISICCGVTDKSQILKEPIPPVVKNKIQPAHVLV